MDLSSRYVGEKTIIIMIYAILILAFLGIVDTLIIYFKNRKPGPVACPLHGDCSAVLKSKYSKFLGIKNEILGLLFYVALFAFFSMSFFSPYFFSFVNYAIIVIGLGALYSLCLTYLQAFKIKEVCLYCIISDFNVVLIFCISLFYLFK